MTGWDVLNNFINVVLAAAVLLVTAEIVFIIGFSWHGINFIKYGFKQSVVNDLLEKLAAKEDIGRLDAKPHSEIGSLRVELGSEISGLRAELETIKVNHFGHFKN
jgi:hypothetical protein